MNPSMTMPINKTSLEQGLNVSGVTEVENLQGKAHCHGEMTSTNMTMMRNLFLAAKLHITLESKNKKAQNDKIEGKEKLLHEEHVEVKRKKERKPNKYISEAAMERDH